MDKTFIEAAATPHRISTAARLTLEALLVSIALAISASMTGCGDDSERGPAGSGPVGETGCDRVCDQIAATCGEEPACATSCPSIPETIRACIVAATDCVGVQACALPAADAGTPADGGGGGTVCLNYASTGAECSAACDTRVVLNDGVFCSRSCAEASDCGSGFFCVSSACRPFCADGGGTDDDAACTALGWSECASGFDGITSFFYCDN